MTRETTNAFIFVDERTRVHVIRLGYYSDLLLLPPFHNVNLSSIVYIHIDVNESKYISMSKFINIYINVDNTRKSYIIKQREYMFSEADKLEHTMLGLIGKKRGN